MKTKLVEIATALDSGLIDEKEARVQLLRLLNVKEDSSWTMERLHRVVTSPEPGNGFEAHLKHLWDNNSPKSIFTLTGLDVSHLMWDKEDTSGLKIKDANFDFDCIIQ